MKLDGKQVFCQGTIDHKPDSKLFGYNNIALDSTGLQSGNGIVNEDQYGVFSSMNGKEGNADQVKYAVNEEDNWHASKLDGSMGVDDSTSDNEKEVRDFVAPTPLTHSSLKIESFEKNKVFYVDKSVMESELPELVVCYRDSAYHIVKDICIDEGVPSQDRFLFDPGVSEENLCTILPPEDINSEIAKERVNLDAFIPDDMKPSAKKEKSTLYLPIPDVLISTEEKGSKNEFSLECDFKKLIPVGETEVDSKEEIANVASKEIFSFGQLLLTPEVGTELSQPESTHNSIGETELQSVQRPCENTIMATASGCEESENGNEQVLVVNPVVYAAEESDFGHQEAVLGTLALDSTAKASDHGHDETVVASNALNFTTEGLENGSSGDKMTSHNGVSVSQSTRKIEDESSCNNRVETKIITFNSLSSPPTASGGEDDSQNCGSGRTETCSFLPEETSTEPLSSQLQYSLGETSFSAAVPLSGLISYSGPIANSGSVSLRSDSSTTSTRSFAFPILQSEWNSSPVRMAKADRRHHRKHRNWREGLLCCRF